MERARPVKQAVRAASVAICLAAALSVVGLALTARAAPATTPYPFVGLQGWKHPTDVDFARLKRANVHGYRLILNWGAVERTRGQYQWSYYDQLFLRAARANVRVLPILLASPRWVCNPSCQRHKPQWPPQTRAERISFNRFAREAAERYGPNGYFWLGKDISEVDRPKWFQIWNEPNIASYWNDEPDAGEYARLVKNAGVSVKNGDRDARVLAGGLPQSATNRSDVIPIYTFLERMFDVSGVSQAVDGVAVHAYAKGNAGIFERLRSAMDALRDSPGGSTKRLFVTEFGWATGSESGYLWASRDGQAARLRDAYRALIARRQEYRLGGAYWFSYKDIEPDDGQSPDWWALHTGLFDRRDRPKPSWEAFTRIAGGQP